MSSPSSTNQPHPVLVWSVTILAVLYCAFLAISKLAPPSHEINDARSEFYTVDSEEKPAARLPDPQARGFSLDLSICPLDTWAVDLGDYFSTLFEVQDNDCEIEARINHLDGRGFVMPKESTVGSMGNNTGSAQHQNLYAYDATPGSKFELVIRVCDMTGGNDNEIGDDDCRIIRFY